MLQFVWWVKPFIEMWNVIFSLIARVEFSICLGFQDRGALVLLCDTEDRPPPFARKTL